MVKKVDPPKKKGGASVPSVNINVTGGAASPSSTDKTGSQHKRTVLSDLPEIIGKWAWRNRWHLTPVLVTAWVGFAGQVSGALVGAITTAAVAIVLYLMRNRTVRGRMYLSEREREIAALYLVVASVWQVAAMLAPVHPAIELMVLMLAVAWPTWRWMSCRKRPARKKITRRSAEWLAKWNDKITTPRPGVPDPLKGSRPVRATAVEPAADALTFLVQLREGVHGSDAATETCRKAVEATLGLPSECVMIEHLRSGGDSTKARVTISAGRHLEANTVDWPGPQVSKEGVLYVGTTPAGKDVEVRSWDKDGVWSGRISGNTGNGKSSSVRVVCTPGIDQGREVLWLIDGKRGTSIPELRPAIDWYATKDAEWGLVIETLVNVMNARQIRRGDAGKSFFRTWEEEDPIITLLIEESSVVRRVLNGRTSGGLSKWDGKVLDLLQQGRALGIRVIQSSQDSMADNLLGGRQARELMAKGFGILHKPGGKMGQTLAQDATEIKVNLLALPNEPGFAAVTMGGKVLAEVARIAYATDDAARAWADSVKDHIRTLTGDDLVAAGAAYARRGVPTPAETEPVLTTAALGLPPVPAEEDEGEQTEEELSATQAWLLKVLGIYGPKTLGELEELGKGARGRKRRNISNNLAELSRAEKVRKDSDRWVLFDGEVDQEVDGR